MNRRILIVLGVLLIGTSAKATWPLPPLRTGLLYISGSSSHNIGEYLPDGTLLRTLTAPGMTQPRGVAVDNDGNLAVVCQGSQRILRLDLNGNVLQTVTHQDLTDGTGIFQSPTGGWYVGNFNPGRVLIFDAAWNHVQTVTAPGMNGVNCVAFDSNGSGMFAVTAALANLVYRFDASGTPIGVTGHPNLVSPMSIADDAQGNHYVSSGSGGVVIKFDPTWSPLFTFGMGVLNGPQGIAVDEFGQLTISNFFANVVHRYDTQGQLLGSWPLTGVNVGRNLAWQTSRKVLARVGTVGALNGYPTAILKANGSTGDALGRLSLGTTQALQIDLDAPPTGPSPAPFVLYAFAGEPGLSDVETLPLGMGLFSFATPLALAQPLTLVNSVGFEPVLGFGALPPLQAPTPILTLPSGVGLAAVVTLQALIQDAGSKATVPFSATNALVLTVN